RGVTGRVRNRAQVAVAVKERARSVGVARRMTVRRERTGGKSKRVNAFAFAMIERDRPAGAAACAGMAAAVRRMKAQTLRAHVSNHRTSDYRNVRYGQASLSPA